MLKILSQKSVIRNYYWILSGEYVVVELPLSKDQFVIHDILTNDKTESKIRYTHLNMPKPIYIHDIFTNGVQWRRGYSV